MNVEAENETKPLDISFFINKYLVPLVERKWIVIIFFLIGVFISIIIFLIVKPEYISQAIVVIESPRSKSSEIKHEGMSDNDASKAYVLAEAEKLRSSSFAVEVFRVLPDETKKDFQDPLDLSSQLLGQSVEIDEPISEGEKSDPSTYFVKEGELLTEMFKRLSVRENINAGLVFLTARTLEPRNGPIILRSYIDVWQATNLEENMKGARAEGRFAEQQRNEAYRKLLKSQEDMILFKKTYEIPVELQMARDMELQSELERLQSKLTIDKERFNYIDRIFLETKMQEAGIQGNIRIISAPALPGSPSRKAVTRLMGTITLVGLLLGVGIVLILDYIRGPIRHERDIESVARIPISGHMPRI